jgi:hypothetical protein
LIEIYAHFRKLEEVLEEHNDERVLTGESRMSEWEENILGKQEEHLATATILLTDHSPITMQKLTDAVEEVARQRELKTKAWMEVATRQTLDSLTKDLDQYREAQRVQIKEFCEVKLQELQSDLDSFQYHAQEILHTEIFGPGVPNPRAKYAPPPTTTIPVEDEPKTPDNRRVKSGVSASTPADPPPHASMHAPPEQTPVSTTRRWKNHGLRIIHDNEAALLLTSSNGIVSPHTRY